MLTIIAKDDSGHFVDPFNAINDIFIEGVAFGKLEQRMSDGEEEIVWTIRTGRESRIYSMAEIFEYTVSKSQEDVYGAIYNFRKIKDED